jgi:hypothetical protein
LAVLYPRHKAEPAALKAMAVEDCRRALSRHAWAPLAAGALKDVREVRTRLKDLFTANPWLEKTLAGASEKMASLEDRLASLEVARKEHERGLPFDDYEDAVERAERFRPAEAATRTERINEHTAELFAREFLKGYRKALDAGGPDKGQEPAFYRAFPFKIEAHLLPNRCLIISFKGAQGAPGFASAKVNFEGAAALLADPAGGFLVALDNDARLEAKEARYFAEQSAGAGLADSKACSNVRGLVGDLQSAERDISAAGKTNPWLDPQAAKLSEALSRARKSLEKAVYEYEAPAEKGQLLHNELLRDWLQAGPHVVEAAAAPDKAAPRAPSDARGVAAGVTASGAALSTRGTAPQVSNVPAGADHVFQEVDYYNFPQSEAVRAVEAASELGPPAVAPVVDLAPASSMDPDFAAKFLQLESRVNEFERRLFYIDRYGEMVQKQQLEKVKLLKELIKVEGKRNRSSAVGISLLALLVGLFALIPAWPQTLDAIRAFFASIGLFL